MDFDCGLGWLREEKIRQVRGSQKRWEVKVTLLVCSLLLLASQRPVELDGSELQLQRLPLRPDELKLVWRTHLGSRFPPDSSVRSPPWPRHT